jgi:hypothetical protein
VIVRRAFAVGLLWSVLLGSMTATADESITNSGVSIYRRGVLTSGAALEGSRQGGDLRLKGMAAACANCHRRSGLGAAEGGVTIPPITGQYLFHSREAATDEAALHYVASVHGNRDPYTDATLARAIREGLDSQGRALGDLMPRFALSDADMAALIDYLKKLGARQVPGVTNTLLHFATIVTPEVDAVKRRGMLDVLTQYFADKNAFPFGPSPQMRTSGKTMYSKSMYVANRHWQLHVWELTGPPQHWREQLEEDFAREPVMAVLSGLGGSHWEPVHDFCEREQVPCLFPNVDVPDVENGDFYSLYLSNGVLLEAELIARTIGESVKGKPARTIVQVYRAGDSGERASGALTAALHGSGIEMRSYVLPAGRAGQGLSGALRDAARADTLVLWLRPSDLEALGEAPATGVTVYVSGLMGGLEQSPLPPNWRPHAQMAYPVDLPDRRVVRVDYPLGWFSFRHIPVVAEQMQADTYLACGVLAETLNHMADVIEPDYLVERIQEILDHRILTGYYPRLTLATGQSLASKGGYLVRFPDATGTRVVAQGEWIVP